MAPAAKTAPLKAPAGFIGFELDLMKAVIDQLVPKLDGMSEAPLTFENVEKLPNGQGVYQLLHKGGVKYVGKTDAKAGLKSRLRGHVFKFMHRENIKPEDIHFRAAQIYVLTAIDVETDLIAHYKPEWNGSSFGSNDPGRKREATDKPSDGFDVQFPVRIDIPGEFVPAGKQTVHAVVSRLKQALPYCLRYETADAKPNPRSYLDRPHADHAASSLVIPAGPQTVRSILKIVLGALPSGWQATQFPSHVILYKEAVTYTHGSII